MTANEDKRIIENENLFRAWVSLPLAILFAALAQNAVMTAYPIVMQIIFVVIAVFFTLSTLSYAAHYTNQRYEGSTEPLFKNKNLSKAVRCLPLAVVFVLFTAISISSSSHIVFQSILAILAATFVLSTLAYTAFYTNDYHAENPHH